MGLNQLILHPIGLKKGKLTATGPDFKFIGHLRDGIPPFLPLLQLFLGMFLRISLAIQRGHAGIEIKVSHRLLIGLFQEVMGV